MSRFSCQGAGGPGQVGRAEKLLAHLSSLFPQDNELAQAHKDISARQTLDEGGYDALADGSGSYRDISRTRRRRFRWSSRIARSKRRTWPSG